MTIGRGNLRFLVMKNIWQYPYSIFRCNVLSVKCDRS